MTLYATPCAAWLAGPRRDLLARLSGDEFRVLSTTLALDDPAADLQALFLIEVRDMQDGISRRQVLKGRLTRAGQNIVEQMARWAAASETEADLAQSLTAAMILQGARFLVEQRMRRRAFVDGVFEPNRQRSVARAEAMLEDPSLVDHLLAADHCYVEDALGVLLAALQTRHIA